MSSFWSPCSGHLETREQVQPCVSCLCRWLPGKALHVGLWYHILCVPPLSHRGGGEGDEVRADSKSEDEFWKVRRFAARCMEGWRSPTWIFPLECQNLPNPLSVFQARRPTGAKLVESTGKSKSTGRLVLRGNGGGVRCVHIPHDPLPAVCTYLAGEPLADATTIPLHVTVSRWKTDGQQEGLLSTSPQWGFMDAQYGQALTRW